MMKQIGRARQRFSVNTVPEKQRNVSVVGAGVRGQLEAKAGGIHQNQG